MPAEPSQTAKHFARLTMANQTSGLLKLDVELRKKIYGMAFDQELHMIVPLPGQPVDEQQMTIGFEKRNTGLLATCRQLRDEALNIYYQSTTFVFGCPDALKEYLKAIPVGHHKKFCNIHVWYPPLVLYWTHRSVKEPGLLAPDMHPGAMLISTPWSAVRQEELETRLLVLHGEITKRPDVSYKLSKFPQKALKGFQEHEVAQGQPRQVKMASLATPTPRDPNEKREKHLPCF